MRSPIASYFPGARELTFKFSGTTIYLLSERFKLVFRVMLWQETNNKDEYEITSNPIANVTTQRNAPARRKIQNRTLHQ